jgi:hypothetical protein
MIPSQVLHIASRYIITALTNGSSKLVHHARLEGLSPRNLYHLFFFAVTVNQEPYQVQETS